MKNYKGARFLSGIGVCTIILSTLFITLSGFRFGGVPANGEVMLNQFITSKEIPDELKFTRWRFTDQKIQNDNLQGMHFNMIIFPTYFESNSGTLDQNVVREKYGSKMLINVNGVKKVGRKRYEGKVSVEMNSTLYQSKIYLKPSENEFYTFDGNFTISAGKSVDGLADSDMNFQIKAYLN